MSEDEYRTESFHVNVGAGDGAIHLLTSNRANEKGQRTIERAILVDGGKEDAVNSIAVVVQHIEEHYWCRYTDPVSGKRHLVFDAIVITHWDSDHWMGVSAYIMEGIKTTLFYLMDNNRFQNLEQVHCCRARYDPPNPMNNFHGAPQTFLYMPWNPLEYTGFLQNANNAWSNNPMIDIEIPGKKLEDPKLRFNRQFKLRNGREWLLGRNLFLHDQDDRKLGDRGAPNTFQTLQTMLNNHVLAPPVADVSYTSWPAMYCVAAEQRILGRNTQIQTTAKNKSSLTFIIVWSEPGNGGQGRQGSVSHYFAGDAHSQLETALAEWMGDFTPFSMKLSHHGSASSNPPDNFAHWNPRNITVSAGEQYGHPRWEILFCVDAWFALRQCEKGKKLRKPFFPCQWPAFLRLNDELQFTHQGFNVEGLQNPESQLYVWLNARFQAIRNIRPQETFPNDSLVAWQYFMDMFHNQLKRDPNKEETREWISGHVIRVMGSISSMIDHGPTKDTADYVYLFGKAELDVNSHWNASMADIWAVKILSAPSGSQHNGLVQVVGEGLLANWVVYNYQAETTSRTEFPADCSRAYVLANLNPNDTNSKVMIDQYPYLGDDRPMSIDIARRNPKWPSREKLGQVQSDREAWGESYAGRRDSWIDFDFEDYVLTEEDKASSDICDLARLSSTPRPVILYRAIPNSIAQAAVYIACPEKKVVEKPPRHFPANSEVVILDEKNYIYGFTDTLHYRKFGLKTIPDGLNPTPVFEDDELFKWLGKFCADPAAKDPAPGFALQLDKVTWPIADKMSRFDFILTMPFPSGYKLRLSTNTGAEQTFAKSTTNTSGEDTAVSFKSLTNMLISRRLLVFGLENSNSPITTTFGTAANFFGVDLNKYPLLKMFTGNFSLVLDASKEYHNAIWFRPGMQYETHLRLQFHVEDSFKSTFNDWLKKFSKDLAVDMLLVIMRKKATWVWSAPTDQMESHASAAFLCSFVLSPTVQLQGVFELADTQIFLSLTLQRPKSQAGLRRMQGRDGAMDTIIKWISSNFGVTDTDSLTKLLGKATSEDSSTISDESILPRRVELLLDIKADGTIKGINTVSIDIEACVMVGRSAVAVTEQIPTLFLFSFGWSKESRFYFKGKLWPVLPDTPFSQYDRAVPEAEEYQRLTPATVVNPEKQLRALDLAMLLSSDPGKQIQIPESLPSEIYACEIALSQEEVSFRGAIRSKPSSSGDNKTPPIVCFEDVSLVASYTWGTKTPADKGFKLKLMIAMNLYLGGKLDPEKPQEEQDDNSAKLSGELAYDKGTWSMEARVYDLSISHLLSFWDVKDQGSVLEFLGTINIDFVSIRYEFTKGPKNPSKLTFHGDFGIAKVATFALNYTNQGGNNWTLTATLAANNKAGPTATIGDLLRGFLDKDTVEILPDAISGAEIQGADGEEALRLLCCRQNDVSVFAILVQVQSVQLWFIQLKTKDGKTKRLVKAAISKILVNVSVINTTINSPWEKLFFMWVQDTTPKETQQAGKKATIGITQTEYNAMKTRLQDSFKVSDEDLMLFKKQESQSGDGKADLINVDEDDRAKEIAINAGMHLVVVAKAADGKPGVILDYLFNGGGGSAGGKASSSRLILDGATENPPPDAAGSQKGTKAPFKVKLGPLSVSNIGLWYKKGVIGITLDASLVLGPVGLALLGFTIGMPFNDKYSIKNPPPVDAMTWGLQGLIVSLDRPPLTVAGGFMRDTSNPKIKVMYSGGLIVGFKPWLFEAMGAYANVTKGLKFNTTTINTDPMSIVHKSSAEIAHADDDTFTFAFIYVRLNGPLFSVGFADFSGLVGGFGVNSGIVLPTVEQVFEFPFVKEPTADDDKKGPIEKMQGLMQGSWFRPAEGVYWGAAGVRVTAFQMLAANIVLVVQFGNGNVVIGLFGVATCDVPSLASPVKFAHAELGIICTYDVNSGIFKLEAQLSPRSFVLAPQCHLTGGLAMYAWFKTDLAANVQAGDWVLTIGGYHKAFHPPRQYPVPPRLGISWSLDKNLSVVGEAYFAITPKLCMGGGRIHAALSLGALYAWFDAFVDFLMNFEPFYFQLQAGLAVGVRFTLDLWLVTIRINAEVGASLDLKGPPFGGVVHVYFWVFAFDVKFGARPSPPPPVLLPRFWEIVLKSGASRSSNATRLVDEPKKNADTAAIVLTCENGLLPPNRKPGQQQQEQPKENDAWFVKSGKFSLMATFQFAVTRADLMERRKILTPDIFGRLTIEKEEEETRSAHADIQPIHQRVFGKPMQLQEPLTSVVTIDIIAPSPKMASQQFFHVLETWKDQKWKLVPIIKPAQVSLWGKYYRNLDPSLVTRPTDDLLDGKDATMPLVMGFSLQPPDPASAGDMINKFNITSDHMESVYLPQQTDRWPLFVDPQKGSDPVWQPRGSSKKMHWKEFKEKWGAIGNEKPNTAVNIWAKRLRFDKASFDEDHKGEQQQPGVVVPKFNPLRGDAPRALLDRFDTMVPALQLIAVGV